MSANTVFVTNISSETSDAEIKQFFSFCGKINSLEVKRTGASQDATVVFEKPTAAKTALLLDHTQLGQNQVHVSSNDTVDDPAHYTTNAERDSDEITQEEKPRSRIIAEYLAHGYVVGDAAAQRAIDLDQKHGISSRFLKTLQRLDTQYKATDRAKGVDQTYGVTPRVNSLLSGLTSYYEKAANTPTGQKVVNFYSQTSRQVQDIHAEARRLADIKKKEAGGAEQAAGLSGVGTTTGVHGTDKVSCKCGSDSSACPCPAGTCACTNCAKSDVKSVPGTNMTTCSCKGETSNCPCEPGHCACASCPKANSQKVDATTTFPPPNASTSVPETAHAAATEKTQIVSSTKVDPLVPGQEKTG